jgi:hypothetical protein
MNGNGLGREQRVENGQWIRRVVFVAADSAETQAKTVPSVGLRCGLVPTSGIEAHRGALFEVIAGEPCGFRSHDDVGETVGVLRDGPRHVRVAVGVGTRSSEGVHTVKVVGEIDDERCRTLDHGEQRMQFDQHQSATGFQDSPHAVHLGVEVVTPAQDADRGVHKVEAVVEFARKGSRIRLECRDLDAAAFGQISKSSQGCGREV